MIRLDCDGRLGNALFQNIGIHFIAKKFDYFVANYRFENEMSEFGLNLYSGAKIKNNFVTYTDENIYSLLEETEEISHGILFERGYFQLKDFVLSYEKEIKKLFIPERVNSGVFVHVRMGDVCNKNPGLEYYRSCLRKIKYDVGYITSDSPGNEIVKSLIQEFELIWFYESEVKTIKFASSFDNIVLSGGTFSWWIGMLSNDSIVYYPKQKLWHGDIFVFPKWNGVFVC